MLRFIAVAIVALIAGAVTGAKAAKAIGVWRPHILVFISTEYEAMRQMNIPADTTFLKRSACNEFVKDNPIDVVPVLSEQFGLAPEEIVLQQATCIREEDESGDEA